MNDFMISKEIAGSPFATRCVYDKNTLVVMAIEEMAAVCDASSKLSNSKINLIAVRAEAQASFSGSSNDRTFKASVDAAKAPLEIAVETAENELESRKTRLRMIMLALESLQCS